MYAMLIADDSDELAVLTLVLQRSGLAVTSARTLEKALTTWLERPADVLMVALSDPDPKAVVREVRSVTSMPLVLVTTHLDESTHVDLLRSGSDLVITRPFSARVLIAQVQALLRRSGGVPYRSLPTLTARDLTLDPGTRSVTVDGVRSRRLTHLEFRLLYTLMIHRSQVLTTEAIVEHVWGYTGEGDRDLVRGLISRLRSKVEVDPRSPRFIRTVPGVGYAFDDVR